MYLLIFLIFASFTSDGSLETPARPASYSQNSERPNLQSSSKMHRKIAILLPAGCASNCPAKDGERSFHSKAYRMFEFTESIGIDASPREIWGVLSDLERWWLPSNPEHISLQIRSAEHKVALGTPIAFRERVAGIEGQADGTVTSFTEGVEAGWEGRTEYRYMGLRFRMREGVSWRLDADGSRSNLSAHVWTHFPPGICGSILEWYAKTILKAVERDRDHARRELGYLKQHMELAN